MKNYKLHSLSLSLSLLSLMHTESSSLYLLLASIVLFEVTGTFFKLLDTTNIKDFVQRNMLNSFTTPKISSTHINANLYQLIYWCNYHLDMMRVQLVRTINKSNCNSHTTLHDIIGAKLRCLFKIKADPRQFMAYFDLLTGCVTHIKSSY